MSATEVTKSSPKKTDFEAVRLAIPTA